MAKKETNKVPLENLQIFRQPRVTSGKSSLKNFYNVFLTKHDSESGVSEEDSKLELVCNRSERRKLERLVRKIITARDKSVQRENVWGDEPEKESSFISHSIVSKGGLQPIHLLVLQDAYDNAVRLEDSLFASLLKLFIDEGFVYAHIDGGNRCDTYIKFFKGDIFIQPGFYNFLPEGDEEVGLHEVIDEIDVNCQKLEKNYPTVYDKLLKSKVDIHFYHDLTQEERSDWFLVLNDGSALNQAELRNRLLSYICKYIRDILNEEFKELLISTGHLLVEDAKRYGCCEYIARLNHLAFTIKTENPTLLTENDKTRSLSESPTWPTHKNLDQDYLSNSAADGYMTKFNSFFRNSYVPLLKIQDKIKSGRVQRLLSKNIMVDFFFLIFYMNKFNLKIQPKMKKNLVRKFHAWEILKSADTKTEYYVGKTDVTYRTWKQMYSGNSQQNIANRFPIIVNELIPLLIEKNIIAKVDSVRGHTKQEKAEMAKNQGLSLDSGPLSSDGIELEILDLMDGEEIHGDHVFPHRAGGSTNVDNGSLETANYNLKKSDKLPEEVPA
jgi:hypothetical protein